MQRLRRRLASWALAVLFCQSAAVFAAPWSSCCPARHAAAADAEPRLLPGRVASPRAVPASRAHRRRRAALQCDAPHGVQLLISFLGPLPAPAISSITLASGDLVATRDAAPSLHSAVPALAASSTPSSVSRAARASSSGLERRRSVKDGSPFTRGVCRAECVGVVRRAGARAGNRQYIDASADASSIRRGASSPARR